MAETKPGSGFLGWLGRQVGYIRHAVKADVTRQTIHREQHVEEVQLPQQPNVTLRRTVIDEVIVKKEPRIDADEPS
jgi:hypothetical protein